MSDDPIIRFADIRRVFCAGGTRTRFDWSQTDIDLRAFARDGVPASRLKGYGYDALIDRVLRAKHQAEAMGVTVNTEQEG